MRIQNPIMANTRNIPVAKASKSAPNPYSFISTPMHDNKYYV